MQKTSLTSNQVIQHQGAVINLPQQVIQFFQSRIQTQQTYCKGLLKLNNKFPNIQAHSTQSSNVLKHLKAIHTEKYHQTMEFIGQLKTERNNFQNLVKKNNEQLQKSTNEIKINELNLKNIVQKINKLHIKGQQQIKMIDQKFLLKQFQYMCNEYKVKKLEDSTKLLDEQIKICKNIRKQYETLKIDGQKAIKKIKKNQKIVHKTSQDIQKQIKQLVKRYTVQQVSLIRNLQYDIDNMIKKTNIFDQVPVQNQQKQNKIPKNYIIKIAGEVLKEQFKIKDQFIQVKKIIAFKNQTTLKQMENKKNHINQENNRKFQEILKYWNQNKNVSFVMNKLTQNYNQYKQSASIFLKHFRQKNINKFIKQQFVQLKKLFTLLWTKNCQQHNFPQIQQLIVYGNCYICTQDQGKQKQQKNSMMQLINKKQYLSDIYFWKFVLFFRIQKSVLQCINKENEKQMYLKNSLFGTLAVSSLNLMQCGIDKYVAKNNIAKIAKACSLTDNQVGDLIKFVQAEYEKYQKRKLNK